MNIDQSKLFFIIAPPRSGTTLLQSLMNTFSGFCNTEESRIAGDNSPSCWEHVIHDGDFSPLEKFIQMNWTKKYFVEKSPPSIECLLETRERFPNANYIFLERNPEEIIRSILNLNIEYSQVGKRKQDLGKVIVNDPNIIEFEEIQSRRLLNRIKLQFENKSFFKNKITIRYENLIESLDSNLANLEKVFGISANHKKATECLKKPTKSKNFRYGYKKISSRKANSMIKLACKLWNYV